MQALSQSMLSTLSAFFGAIGIAAAFVAAVAGFITFLANAEISRRSDLRIAQNEATTATAGAKAAEANSEAASATRAAGLANSAAAEANRRAEQLKNDNLVLELGMLELRKSVRGREISDDQQKMIVAGARGLKLPDLVVYYNEGDPEATMYALSISSVLKDIGLRGRVAMMSRNPPQTGVVYYGTGTPDEGRLIEVLMKAKVVGMAARGPEVFSNPASAGVLGAPPGSIIVGLKPPGSTPRVSEPGGR